jgi:hypothetical protein
MPMKFIHPTCLDTILRLIHNITTIIKKNLFNTVDLVVSLQISHTEKHSFIQQGKHVKLLKQGRTYTEANEGTVYSYTHKI